MKRVALLGDSITEYMPYIIDKEAKRGFNVPLITLIITSLLLMHNLILYHYFYVN